ncbi:unnamed protein product, partial [Hymenolepis diminuta]
LYSIYFPSVTITDSTRIQKRLTASFNQFRWSLFMFSSIGRVIDSIRKDSVLWKCLVSSFSTTPRR